MLEGWRNSRISESEHLRRASKIYRIWADQAKSTTNGSAGRGTSGILGGRGRRRGSPARTGQRYNWRLKRNSTKVPIAALPGTPVLWGAAPSFRLQEAF